MQFLSKMGDYMLAKILKATPVGYDLCGKGNARVAYCIIDFLCKSTCRRFEQEKAPVENSRHCKTSRRSVNISLTIQTEDCQ